MTELKSKFSDGFNEAYSSGRYMKPVPQIQRTGICSVMLEMSFGSHLLAKGTGWFWRQPDGIALVTAWHNLTGLHHTLRTPLSPHLATPDRIRFRYVATKPQTFQDAELSLYLDDERTKPRWVVHPTCGSFFDFAYIGLTPTGIDVACINDEIPLATDPLQPGADVFTVGFPQGVRTMSVLPVWKRGTIASDPDVIVDGHPKFLIDISGRGGLSGAPVYRVPQGFSMGSDGAFRMGGPTQFLGIYTGRAADQLPPAARTGESTDLGFVWRSDVVLEMLTAGVLDEQPEVGKGTQTISEIWDRTDS